jgi:hypothetical protein
LADGWLESIDVTSVGASLGTLESKSEGMLLGDREGLPRPVGSPICRESDGNSDGMPDGVTDGTTELSTVETDDDDMLGEPLGRDEG